jgi:hypothetical protein
VSSKQLSKGDSRSLEEKTDVSSEFAFKIFCNKQIDIMSPYVFVQELQIE